MNKAETTTPCLYIDIQKLKANLETLSAAVKSAGCSLTIVTKSFCADKKIVEMLDASPLVDYLADARLQNLKTYAGRGKPTVLLRLPQASEIEDVISYADISLNSEPDTLRLLNAEAARRNKKHKVILMIDLGDLREGIFFMEDKKILKTAEGVLGMKNLELYGIGANLTCYGAVIPTTENLSLLTSWAERIRTRYGIELPVVSGGNSSSFYLIEKGGLPRGINNLRLGEAFIVGREAAYKRRIKNTFDDGVTLEARIIEVQVKPSMPAGERGVDAFGKKPVFKDQGMMKRAICAVGRQDLELPGIIPQEPGLEILGASSDHLILTIDSAEGDYKTGDTIRFIPDYVALLRLFTSPYVGRVYSG
ncbi:MAG: alanine/ornithine racemase family PLP-dependent enzyme [Spirochaetaceae bacterium]|jgi:predicted amino acid racemase|nr:alanine/ornithine racemase family PLP-dependent enzyme [Spirochaetaceae bacterium]